MMQRMHHNVLSAGEDPSVVVNHITRLVRARDPARVNYAGDPSLILKQ